MRRRLIPARAGSTVGASFYHKGLRAHPRSRGEHTDGSASMTTTRGSSPLARGALSAFGDSVMAIGLIPARAGSTWVTFCAMPGSWAHPRSRGEHSVTICGVSSDSGSSPLARGAPVCSRTSPPTWGLIPARAGSTHGLYTRTSRLRAHPRSRGEHAPPIDGVQQVPGSSPLARGAPKIRGIGRRATGLIPARAGSTALIRRLRFEERAHPRSRGEHRRYSSKKGTIPGSSPLARGAPLVSTLVTRTSGLIPARAGSTAR